MRLEETVFGRNATLRRVCSLLLILVAGWIDYATGPDLASAPFYVPVLLLLALVEAWPVCLAYSVLAAAIYLSVDLLSVPGSAHLIYPYWKAFARFVSFALISVMVTLLTGEHRRLRESERVLREQALELEARNRRLEETLSEIKRLQADLLRKERQAALAEAIYVATSEIERPLASVGVYAEELARLIQRSRRSQVELVLDEMEPLVQKLSERSGNMESILQSIRDLRKAEAEWHMLRSTEA